MVVTRRLSAILLGILTAGCSVAPVRTNAGAQDQPVRMDVQFDHGVFDELLHRHVAADGTVDYAGLQRDRAVLQAYLDSLAEVDPHQLATQEQIAYWLNAYNAGVLFGVLHYGVGDTAACRGFFAGVRTRCGGLWWSLEDIRDRVLRPLHDPRLLLALCNGWRGGPRLRAEAFAGSRLEGQLDAACRDFLAAPGTCRIDDAAQRVALAPPCSTFADDFAVPPYLGLRGFVTRHALPRAWFAAPFPIDALPADTALNGRLP